MLDTRAWDSSWTARRYLAFWTMHPISTTQVAIDRNSCWSASSTKVIEHTTGQVWMLIDFWVSNFLTRELRKSLIWSPQICEIFGFCMISSICVDWRLRYSYIGAFVGEMGAASCAPCRNYPVAACTCVPQMSGGLVGIGPQEANSGPHSARIVRFSKVI